MTMQKKWEASFMLKWKRQNELKYALDLAVCLGGSVWIIARRLGCK